MKLTDNVVAGAEVLFHHFDALESIELGDDDIEFDGKLTTVQARISHLF